MWGKAVTTIHANKAVRDLFKGILIVLVFFFCSGGIFAATKDYVLGAGDVIRITVYEHPDMTTVARIGESGNITFPLLGEVKVGETTVVEAEALIATLLRKGAFVRAPQVSLIVEQFQSQQVSVLGEVNQPGKYPIEGLNASVIDFLALAGGVTPQAADKIKLIMRGTQNVQVEIDLIEMFKKGETGRNITLGNGDIIYVPIMDRFYVYGEVNQPGVYRLERDLTVMQALAVAGGLTGRGTERGVKVNRKDPDGSIREVDVKLTDKLQPDDVVYVKESLF